MTRPILRLKEFAQDNEAPLKQCPEPCGKYFRPTSKEQRLCDSMKCGAADPRVNRGL